VLRLIVLTVDAVFHRHEVEKTNSPFGVCFLVVDPCDGTDLLLRGIKRSLSKGEEIVDPAIWSRAVTFDRIDTPLFGEVGNVCDHAPIAHVTLQINMGNRLEGFSFHGSIRFCGGAPVQQQAKRNAYQENNRTDSLKEGVHGVASLG
jgi:hypothetical protein